MANEIPDAPIALLRLEQLCIRSELHFSPRRALNDRRRALRDQRMDTEQQIQIETESFNGRHAGNGRTRPPRGWQMLGPASGESAHRA